MGLASIVNVSIANVMSWSVRGSKPSGGRFSTPVQNVPGTHPASYTRCPFRV